MTSEISSSQKGNPLNSQQPQKSSGGRERIDTYTRIQKEIVGVLRGKRETPSMISVEK